ncbi:MFS transporter [Herbidospora mongoliensis]|uniref:MFS transporter n=1 Tax=Herbidospora mongoliensis TaxID=688067 RepID=UPI0008330775|nr:MFS transporter [Herbidospora mongoliensis]
MNYAWRVCLVTGLGLVLIGMSGSTLNVALPVVVRHFHASPFAANWILLSFMLVSTATLVFFGRVADLLGRRGIYLAGFALFTVASGLAGLAPDVGWLIAMRAVQAVGASMILANGTVIITDAFPPDRLGQGMGVYIGTLSIAQLAGPTLGGLIADTLGWRWIFWVNVPAGLVALVAGLVILRPGRPGQRAPLDAAGNLVIFALLSAALYALTEGSLVGLAVALCLVPVLVVIERRAADPVLNGALFAAPLLVFSNLASFCAALARSSLVLLAGLYFQAARGVDVLQAGLAILPVPAGMALASPLAGVLARRHGAYAVSVGGAVLAAVGMAVLALSTEAPYPVIAAGLFLAGCGNGTFLTGNTTQVMNALPPGSLGVVNGFRLMIQNIGGALSIGATLTLLTGAVTPDIRAQVYQATISLLSPSAVEQLMGGFRVTYTSLFFVSLAGALCAALARPSSRPRP